MRERSVLSGVLFLAAAMSVAVAQTKGNSTTNAAAIPSPAAGTSGARGPAGADAPAGIAGPGLSSSSDPGPSAAESATPVPQSTIGAYDPTGGATLTGRSASETGSHPGTATAPSGGDCLANSDNMLPGCPIENGPTR